MNSSASESQPIINSSTTSASLNNFKELISDVVESVVTNDNHNVCPKQQQTALNNSRNLIVRKKVKRKPHHPPAQIPSSTEKNKHRTYFRAPGLEAPSESLAANSLNLHVCQICSFSCSSIFHYNSHMNTHGYHKCLMCNYTARTEGRLKKHMKTSHSRADRIAVGLDKLTDEELAKKTENKDKQDTINNNTSTATMASIVAMVNQAAANADIINNGTTDLQRLVDDLNTTTTQTNQFNGQQLNLTSLLEFANKNNILAPSALESIRALTERSSLSDILAMGNPSSQQAIDDLEAAEADSIVCFFFFLIFEYK